MSGYLIGLLTGLCAGVALGVTGLTLVDYHERPHCPTEDSCVVDYRKSGESGLLSVLTGRDKDGAWYVQEVTP